MTNRCADCRDGEHEDYDLDVELVIVKEEGSGRWIKRAWLCKDHRDMYEGDGFEVKKT